MLYRTFLKTLALSAILSLSGSDIPIIDLSESISDQQLELIIQIRDSNQQYLDSYPSFLRTKYRQRFLPAWLTISPGPTIISNLELNKDDKLVENDRRVAILQSVGIILYEIAHLSLLTLEKQEMSSWSLLQDFSTFLDALKIVHQDAGNNTLNPGNFRDNSQSASIPFSDNNIDETNFTSIALESYKQLGDRENAAKVSAFSMKWNRRAKVLRDNKIPSEYITDADRILFYPFFYLGTDSWRINAELESDYKRIILEKNQVRQAAMLHNSIVRVHPFLDANGRMARLFMNALLTYHGLNPVHFLNAKAYLAALKSDTWRIISEKELYTDAHPSELELLIRQQQP